jgi:hypothetical protein
MFGLANLCRLTELNSLLNWKNHELSRTQQLAAPGRYDLSMKNFAHPA